MPWKRLNLDHLIGTKYGHLTLVDPLNTPRNQARSCLFRCDCGTERVINLANVQRGRTKSCGCSLRSEALAEHNRTHGHTDAPEYIAWGSMVTRCTNPNCWMYPRYGGRGIKVCERWASFENFLADMGHRPGKGYSLDRINVDKDYSPENCRWATTKEQARNTSRTRLLTHNGITKPLCDWADEFGIKPHTLRFRIESGWAVERALTTPASHPRPGPLAITYNGLTLNAVEWGARLGIKPTTIRARLRKGWPVDKALSTS